MCVYIYVCVWCVLHAYCVCILFIYRIYLHSTISFFIGLHGYKCRLLWTCGYKIKKSNETIDNQGYNGMNGEMTLWGRSC